MIDEKKIQRMTKMAIYEEKGGKKDKKVAGYFKSDYVGMQMLISFIVATVAFVIALVAYLCLNFEEVMADIYSMDLVATGKKLLLLYFVLLVAYLVITYALYLVRYVKARKRLNGFVECLDRLNSPQDEES